MTEASPIPHVVRLAFLGACQQYRPSGWRRAVEARTRHVFASRSLVRAQRTLCRLLGDWDGGPLELRLAGYSWGAWTALQLLARVHARPHRIHPRLAPDAVRVRLATLDPVGTLRTGTHLAVWPDLQAWNVFQQNGCGRLRCPGPSRWYRGRPLAGAWNLDVTEEGADHLDLGYRGWGGYDEGLASVLGGDCPWFVERAASTAAR